MERTGKIQLLATLACVLGLSGCDALRSIEQKSAEINKFEKSSYNLARDNRELRVTIEQLKAEIQDLKSEISFLNVKFKTKNNEGSVDETLGEDSVPSEEVDDTLLADLNRMPASIKELGPVKKDLVQFKVYKWRPEQLIKVGEKSYKEKKFEEAAQNYHAYFGHYSDKKVEGFSTDYLLFQAGVAAYESQQHYDWTLKYLGQLIKDHPKSDLYRSAKLWLVLAQFKQGNQKEFYKGVEEFRVKYRNTPEWKILSAHYEELTSKYKQ